MSEIDVIGTIVKFCLFFANLFFWIIGILIIGFGTWVIQQENELLGDNTDIEVYKIVYAVTIAIILVGAVVFTVAFVGCIGTIRENLTILIVFIGLLIAEVVIELSLIITGFSLYSTLKEEIVDSLTDTLAYYLDSTSIRDVIDIFQKMFACCGIGSRGFKDWENNEYFSCKEGNPFYLACSVPWSCCKEAKDDVKIMLNRMCGQGALKEKSDTINAINTEGCVSAVHNTLKANLSIVLGLVTGIIFLQVLGIFLAVMLRIAIKSSRIQFEANLAQAAGTSEDLNKEEAQAEKLDD